MSTMFSLLFKRWKELLILGLLAFLFLKGCNGNADSDKEIINVDGKDYELLKQTIDTVFVEKEVKVPTYVPQYVERVITETIEIPVDVDSLAIIKDYYSKYKVIDTLQLSYDFPNGVTDSLGNKPASNLGYGIVTDIISQNKIESRDIDWFFRIPTVYNTTIVKELPKTELYYGLGAGVDGTNGFGSISGNILVKTKKMKIFGVNVGMSNQLGEYKPFVGTSVYWKLGKK